MVIRRIVFAGPTLQDAVKRFFEQLNEDMLAGGVVQDVLIGRVSAGWQVVVYVRDRQPTAGVAAVVLE